MLHGRENTLELYKDDAGRLTASGCITVERDECAPDARKVGDHIIVDVTCGNGCCKYTLSGEVVAADEATITVEVDDEAPVALRTTVPRYDA